MATVVAFKKGLSTRLPDVKTPGMFYVTTDDHGLYLDINESTRIRLCDIPKETFDKYGAADAVKSELTTEIGKKQDKLVFESEYNAETNKAATMTDVTNAVSGLSGAMHWKGTVENKPDTAMGANYQIGDVVTYKGVECAWDGEVWQELGDESKYSEKVSGWDNAAAKAHEHSNMDELNKFKDGDKEALDGAVADIAAIKDSETIDSFGDVETELAKKQNTIPDDTYDNYGAADAVKDELIGEEADDKDEDTINGAKAYADDAVETALTWGEF